MSTTTTVEATPSGVVGVVALAAMALGALVAAFGVLLLPQSGLGGAWIVAIGLSLFLAGFFAVDPVADRMGLAPRTQRTLSLGFAVLAVFLLGSFVAVNAVSFEAGTAISGGSA